MTAVKQNVNVAKYGEFWSSFYEWKRISYLFCMQQGLVIGSSTSNQYAVSYRRPLPMIDKTM